MPQVGKKLQPGSVKFLLPNFNGNLGTIMPYCRLAPDSDVRGRKSNMLG